MKQSKPSEHMAFILRPVNVGETSCDVILTSCARWEGLHGSLKPLKAGQCIHYTHRQFTVS